MSRIAEINDALPEPLCDDYASFLEAMASRKDIDCENPVPAWKGAKNGDTTEDELIFEFGVIFTAATVAKYASSPKKLKYWHKKLLPFAYPIGRTSEGAPIVQAAAGSRRGEVFVTDHEFWPTWKGALIDRDEDELEEIEDLLEEVGASKLADFDADLFFEMMTNDDYEGTFFEAEESFSVFYGVLSAIVGTGEGQDAENDDDDDDDGFEDEADFESEFDEDFGDEEGELDEDVSDDDD